MASVQRLHTSFAEISNNGLFSSWFVPVLDFIEKYDVKMWSYINCDWDSFPMWISNNNHAPNVFWGDTRLQSILFLSWL